MKRPSPGSSQYPISFVLVQVIQDEWHLGGMPLSSDSGQNCVQLVGESVLTQDLKHEAYGLSKPAYSSHEVAVVRVEFSI
ncbi:hypothetical protein ACS04_33075 [Streptomyces roseus]|uniref:Uncharacterized protein n=1 Tax=Streptomyces roseus TaxID=66430 RepID=A0A0J7A917_9ACTN|nr:hypothetical protein ACS04_33075 [Streptomyces roseus]